MSLGANRDYKTTDRRARTLLAKHAEIMNRLIAEGMTREAASAEALKQMESTSTRYNKQANSKFQRGSGVYACVSCTRKTRATGGDNHDLQMCEECYEMAGIENAITDGNNDTVLLAKFEELKARCIAKGGKL